MELPLWRQRWVANALKILLEGNKLREKYGKEGRRIVEQHFSWDHLAKN